MLPIGCQCTDTRCPHRTIGSYVLKSGSWVRIRIEEKNGDGKGIILNKETWIKFKKDIDKQFRGKDGV